jgi:hypothetical protein
MSRKISPIVAVVIALIVLIGVGLLSTRLFAGNGSDKQVIVKPANPNDPHFRPDPKLAGGGGAGY